ncbi:hypothetical protein PP352_21650 [Mycobacteroides abscessus]|nr:hypothetical protein [Mycobacteroides abscessus]
MAFENMARAWVDQLQDSINRALLLPVSFESRNQLQALFVKVGEAIEQAPDLHTRAGKENLVEQLQAYARETKVIVAQHDPDFVGAINGAFTDGVGEPTPFLETTRFLYPVDVKDTARQADIQPESVPLATLNQQLLARGWVCFRQEADAQFWHWPPSLEHAANMLGVGRTYVHVECLDATRQIESVWIGLTNDCPAEHPNGWWMPLHRFYQHLATIEAHRPSDPDPIPDWAIDRPVLDGE